MNYKRLLEKYINHVSYSEGTDFILWRGSEARTKPDYSECGPEFEFSDDEWDELCKLAREQ